MKKNQPQKSPYERAKSASTDAMRLPGGILLLIAFLVFLTAIKPMPLLLKTTGGTVVNPQFEASILVLSTFIAVAALCAATISSTNIAVLQMEQARDQAETQRSNDIALVNAIDELTQELRRRPEVPSSVVTFALFGPAALIRPAPESPSDKGVV